MRIRAIWGSGVGKAGCPWGHSGVMEETGGHGKSWRGSLLESLESWGVLSEGMGLVGVPGELWGTECSSGGLYPPQFAEQLGDAGQAPRRPLVVTVLEHQLHHLRVPRAHRLLEHWGHGVPSARGHPHPWTVSPSPRGVPVPVHPLAFSRPTLALCRSSTRTDSRWPRDTASSRGVRPRGSVSSTSCWKGGGGHCPLPVPPQCCVPHAPKARCSLCSPFSQCCQPNSRALSCFQAFPATAPYYPSVASPSSATSSSSASSSLSPSLPWYSQSPTPLPVFLQHSQFPQILPVQSPPPSVASSPCPRLPNLPPVLPVPCSPVSPGAPSPSAMLPAFSPELPLPCVPSLP